MRFWRGRTRALVSTAASLAALLLLAAACGGGATTGTAPASEATSEASEGGAAGQISPDATLTVAVGVDPDSLDPVQQTTTTVSNIVDSAVETLVTVDQDGKLTPLLAESWDVSPDGLTVTFHLRSGVSFQDGEPFDAQAVKKNFERLLDPNVKVPQRAPFTVIQSVEAPDDSTVVLHLSHTSPALVSALTATTAGILAPDSWTQHGNSYENIVFPVGTGPFAFKEYVKGDHVSFDRYDGYWGEKPYYAHLTFKIVPEAATRETMLLAGQADVIILPPISDLAALEQNPQVKVLVAPSDRTIFIALNTQSPKLKDPRVRQALNYAVDKDSIIKNVLFGAATKLDAPSAPSLFGYCPVSDPYDYDPAKAKELLSEAGVSNLSLKFIAPTGRYVQDFQAAQAIAGNLAAIGVDANPETMDWPTYIATITRPLAQNDLDMHFLGWAPSYLDASQQMVQFEKSQWPPNGLATSFYTNPDVEALVAQADQEVDQQKRADLYCQAMQKIWDDAPWIFLWTQNFPIVYSASVTNVGYLPIEKFVVLHARPAK
ncbi:MAG: ABC transporter substrate-binding protein [Clostridia bacterium]|nr:ABC transporter substrate-binding protein [Clostridia bacterium]